MEKQQQQQNPQQFVVIGGGPAGLTAAYELTRHAQRPIVLEKDNIVGGIARTENYKGFHFDMGGHRFFTKSEEVNKMWHEVLLNEFLQRPRLSRIFYKKRFFNYPLKPANALAGLGFYESMMIGFSYLRWKLFPHKVEETFEQWVTNRFGRRLFLTFFKTYTEKVWGIPCSELKAEWAAQRIKDLSLKTALLSMFIKPGKTIKTLIEQFDYPRLGPGMMWNAVTKQINNRGGEVRMNSGVSKIRRDGNRISGVVCGTNGTSETVTGSHFISSMPLVEFINKLDPPPPPNVVEAAGKLHYRDFLTVCLILDKPDLFPDNWIYIHDPDVKVGRIQNFKNWSPHMVPDQTKSSLGLEYFCNEGDDLWTMPDDKLIELAKRELEQITLAKYADCIDGCVFRVPKSYPVYDSDYVNYLGVVRQYVDSLENFRTVGRNGLHRYNNQDHSMLTGMYAVRSLLFGQQHDLWSVNADKEYHEEVKDKPTGEVATLEEGLALVFGKIDRVAMGVALAALCGVGLFLLTIILVIKGGPTVGQNLSLLNQYFPGYKVTGVGSIIGFGYGALFGFIAGWMMAAVRNVVMFVYAAVIRRGAERKALRSLLEYI